MQIKEFRFFFPMDLHVAPTGSYLLKIVVENTYYVTNSRSHCYMKINAWGEGFICSNRYSIFYKNLNQHVYFEYFGNMSFGNWTTVLIIPQSLSDNFKIISYLKGRYEVLVQSIIQLNTTWITLCLEVFCFPRIKSIKNSPHSPAYELLLI